MTPAFINLPSWFLLPYSFEMSTQRVRGLSGLTWQDGRPPGLESSLWGTWHGHPWSGMLSMLLCCCTAFSAQCNQSSATFLFLPTFLPFLREVCPSPPTYLPEKYLNSLHLSSPQALSEEGPGQRPALWAFGQWPIPCLWAWARPAEGERHAHLWGEFKGEAGEPVPSNQSFS